MKTVSSYSSYLFLLSVKFIFVLLTNLIFFSGWSQTYCSPTFSGGCGGGSPNYAIATVKILGNTITLDNLPGFTGCNGTNGYMDYTASTPKPDLTAGTSYNIYVNKWGAVDLVIWIDYNDNGTFETSERIYAQDNYNVPTGGAATTSFTPTVVGTHRMRVMLVKDTEATATGINPCGTYVNGEAEDYLINVVPNYCIPTHGGKVDQITQMTFQTITDNTFGTNGYYNHTTNFPIPDLTTSSLYSMKLSANGNGNHTAVVWIDFNDNGTFETSEWVGSTSASTPPVTNLNISITTPMNPPAGNHRMRVLWQYNTGSVNYYDDKPCTDDNWGQTVDYTINIINNCSGMPNAGITSVTPNSGIPSSTYTVSASGYDNTSGLTYQWQYRINGGAWINQGSATSTYTDYTATSTATIGDQIDWQLLVTCTNSSQTAYSTSSTFTVIMGTPAPGGVSSGLTSWFKASNLVTKSGTSVSMWQSVIGTYQVKQTTSAKQPTYFDFISDVTRSTGINFNPGIYFDGSDDELLSSNASGLLGATGTAILGFRFEGGTTVFGTNGDGSYDQYYQIKEDNTGYYYTTSAGSCWQRAQSQTIALSSPTKMRVTSLTGGTFATTYINRNGNTNTGAQINPGYGAIVNSPLAFGSRGIDEYSKSTIPEFISYNRVLNSSELSKVNSYLAIKYGITLGGPNIGLADYIASGGSIIWSNTTNSGNKYDIAGIGRDDISTLDQRKSHSINGTGPTSYSDILTVANGSNFTNPTAFSSDKSFFIWGHNNGVMANMTWPNPNFMTENGVQIQSIFQRVWKAQESGSVGTVTMEFDMSSIPGANNVIANNDLTKVRLLVDEDGIFNDGTSYAVNSSSINGNKIYFQFDFVPGSGIGKGFYFTIASTEYKSAPLPITLTSFSGKCNNDNVSIIWKTASESNVNHYEVERSRDGNQWDLLGSVTAVGNSSTENTYTLNDNINSSTAYYRLRSIDNDGKSEVFGPISIICEGLQNSWKIYPIPVIQSATISIQSQQSFDNILTISDINGRIVYSKNIHIEEGINHIEIDSEKLTIGTYFVKMKDHIKGFSVLKFIKL